VKRDYELGFILSPEVSEEETRSTLDRLEQIVVQHGGQIVKVNQWGRRRLAYPIERHRDGYYVFIDMILTPETVIELERSLRVSEIVLRHMLIKRDAKAAQKDREERDARAAATAAKAEAEQAAQSKEETPEEPINVPELSSDELVDAPAATDNSETVEA
jgi:small subunit ribosomal protein S6